MTAPWNNGNICGKDCSWPNEQFPDQTGLPERKFILDLREVWRKQMVQTQSPSAETPHECVMELSQLHQLLEKKLE